MRLVSMVLVAALSPIAERAGAQGDITTTGVTDSAGQTEQAEEGWAPYAPTGQVAPTPNESVVAAQPRSAGELLSQAHVLYAAQDFKGCVPLTQAVLDAADASAETRLDAYQLQGGALAMTGDSAGAEAAFAQLLQGRPGFSLPQEAPAAARDSLEAARAERVDSVDAAPAPRSSQLDASQPVAAQAPLHENPWFWGVAAAAALLASAAAGGIVYALMTRPPDSDLPSVVVP